MAKDRDRRGGKGQSERDRRRPPKKKISVLNTENITWIDYKDVNLLRRFMSERAKIRARRVTGNSAQQQRAVARAIRIAREMALLPYSVRQVTQRSKGGRGRDRDRDMPREAPGAPGSPPPPPPPTGAGVEEGAPPEGAALPDAAASTEAAPAPEASTVAEPTAPTASEPERETDE
jgi:small subunit ribosomal protein S18